MSGSARRAALTARAEAGGTDARHGMLVAHLAGYGFAKGGGVVFHLDDDARVGKPPKHVAQRRNPKLSERRRGLRGYPTCTARGSFERLIVMNHHVSVGGQVDVELEAVRPGIHSRLERRHPVFRSQGHAAAVGEHQGMRRIEECHRPMLTEA